MSTLQLTGGWIEVIAGVMFSGKSEELMRRVRRSVIARKRVQVFTAHLVAIDEAQFLDEDICALASALASRGRRVILAGTDTDFRGEPFGPMPRLLAIAEVVDKLHAICVLCGAPACRNQRLVEGRPARYDSPVIQIGGQESYEARCRACHQVPRRDEDQGR